MRISQVLEFDCMQSEENLARMRTEYTPKRENRPDFNALAKDCRNFQSNASSWELYGGLDRPAL